MKHIIATLALAASAFTLAPGAIAQTADAAAVQAEGSRIQATLRKPGQIVNNPAVTSWSEYSHENGQRVAANGVPGGVALRVGVPKKGANPYSSGLQTKTTAPVSRGDTITAAFWARRTSGGSTRIPAFIQEAGGTYTTFAEEQADVGSDWELFTLSGPAPRDFAAGELQLSLHTATGKQELEFGPAFIINVDGSGRASSSGSSAPAAANVPQLDGALAQIEKEAVRIYRTLPRASELANFPSVESWSEYGHNNAQTLNAPEVPGGKAMRVFVKGKLANAYDSGLQNRNIVPVASGDTVAAVFWARAAKTPSGRSSVEMPAFIQQAGGSYTTFGSLDSSLTSGWSVCTLHGEAPASYGADGLQLSLQTATGEQEIDIGPAFIMNLGAGDVDGSVMPKGCVAAPTGAAPAAAPRTSPTPSDVRKSGSVEPPRALRKDYAALLKKLPGGATLISQPMPSLDTAYGGESRMVKDRKVPGGEALEVRTAEAKPNSWDVGVNLPITDGVDADDVLLLAVWARAIEARNESQTAALQPIRIQESGGEYKSAAEGAAYLTNDWKLHYLPVKSANSFGAGDSGITYHLGLAPQTVRIGPSYLIKFPAGTDVQSLPKTRIDYKGRDANHPWRAKAMESIDRHRKADLTVRVVDSSGAPVPNAEVRVAQKKHAFNFGTFVGHEFGEPRTENDRRIHEVVDESFNALTVPTYWADWGWAGPGSKEDDYRSTLAYVAGRGFPYRAHTIMWPGERWMPSRILEASSVAERRRLALDQVREVMEALRDAETQPMGVELTNEPRDNRYFQENGDPKLVEDAFRLAHSIAPDLPLFINDYGILNNGGYNTANIEFYHEWLRDMLGKGVPVGGIGFQGHFSAGLTPPERLIELLEDFSEYDLPLHITEFDIETLDEDAQAAYTRDAVLASLSVPAVEAFIFWGFWEGDHWKPNAAMIREDWSRKPAYDAWRKLAFEDLWTDETVRTGRNGEATVRGMHGDYTVTVNGRTQTVSLDADGETVTVTR